jgi:MoaA/NifB/PqqE/SkfB family radical SAM enzyme
MTSNSNSWVQVDDHGRLVLPPGAIERFGLQPGARLRMEWGDNQIRLHRPVTHLAKIYIEPTDMCNLQCSMCIRTGWEEPLGRMAQSTFQAFLAQLEQMQPKPIVFFGGMGEPMFHPHTIEWIAEVRQRGAPVEMITNGTLLNEKRARALINAGLDVLWVSIDGATPEQYADVRLGAELPNVLTNLQTLRRMRPGGHHPRPVIGVSFVAMKRNVHDLPKVIAMGRRVGAQRFIVTNVLPYTADMQDEQLYLRTTREIAYLDSPWLPKLSLPKMNLNELTRGPFLDALGAGCNVTFAGNNLAGSNDVCNFIESGSISIRWDGGVSPCWALMHTHTTFLHGKPRRNQQHILGNINSQNLLELWNDPDYVAYRERVHAFGFAPCTSCGGCDLSESNLDDCIGSGFPSCGGCMWAQGVIQCP